MKAHYVCPEYLVKRAPKMPLPHPGEMIREDILPALGLSVSKAAEQLGVTRVALSRVIHGKAAISATMARRLEAWLNGPEHGPSAESWLRGQLTYDLWQAEQAPRPRVQPAPTASYPLLRQRVTTQANTGVPQTKPSPGQRSVRGSRKR